MRKVVLELNEQDLIQLSPDATVHLTLLYRFLIDECCSRSPRVPGDVDVRGALTYRRLKYGQEQAMSDLADSIFPGTILSNLRREFVIQ